VENSTPPEYPPSCSIQRLVELQTPSSGRREADCVWRAVFGGWRVAYGRWRVAGGGRRAAEIMTSVYIIVRILSLARPPRRNLTMPHDHGVDTCSLRFCRNGRQLDLGESRSPTQIFQGNLLLASHGLWVYVCVFGPG